MEKIYKKINSKKIYFLIFIIILTLLSSINVFHKGIIFNHDISFHLHRIIALSENISIGKYIPVYFNYLNGFGYGNGLFYPDLFLYIPALLYNFGLSIEICYKIFIILINLFSILNMYLCVKKITNKKYCGYIAMNLYALSNYRLIDLVERSALGEMLVFMFLPLVILGVYETFYGENKKNYYFIIGICGVCFSHVISFYLTCVFIIVFAIMNVKCLKNKNRLLHFVVNIIISVLITSSFWMPMLEQLISNQSNILSIGEIYKHVVPFPALFIDFPTLYLFKEWVPSGIGIIYYVGTILYIKNLKQNKFVIKDKFLFTLFTLGIISVILLSCSFIWKIDIFLKLFSIIQFPWRLYMFSTTFLIIALSILLKNIKKSTLIKTLLIYTILIYIINSCLYSINIYIDKPTEEQIMLGEYLPKNFDINIISDYENDDIEYTRENETLKISLKKQVSNIEVPLIYYKGYKACNNEECFDVFKTENGLVGININNKVTKLNVYYDGTTIYKVSKYITLLGIIVFLIYIIKK